ncbi:hypothetical protein GCM10028807_20810 [Spirosoma daeguense]
MWIFTLKEFKFSILISIALLFSSINLFGQSITGTVFRDFNANGTRQTTEPAVAGVEVRAFNNLGVNVTPGGVITTPASGTYSVTPTTGAGTYRLEFTIPATFSYLNEGFRASGGAGTSIQFAATGATGINFPVSTRTDYCQTTPPLITPCYVSGDPLATGSTVANEHVMVSLPYGSTGASPSITPLSDAYQIGSVWGLAFQRETNKLFSAAFLKRHTGLGPAGLGGIYLTTTTGTISNSTYVDLENTPFNLNLGQSQIAGRSLPGSGTTSSNDAVAFDAVGKVGLGGMAISSNGATLYTVDLFNRRLLALSIGNPAKASLVASDLTIITIPNPGCTNGVARPFAVHVHDGKVYVGVVCTGESSGGSASNLYAHIYSMNEGSTTLSSTPIFSFRLNYTKGYVHTGDTGIGSTWETWASDFSGINVGSSSTAGVRVARPQPMLSDIAFADNGDMIMAFMDRGGHQLGFQQRTTNSGTTPLYNGYIGGDILRANFNGTNWTLENNGVVGSLTTAGTAAGQGPGTPNANGYASGREFFYEDNYSTTHEETSMGSIAIVPGSNQTLAATMDPLTVWTGGFSRFNNTTGAAPTTDRVQIYQSISGSDPNPATLGKANGLGDIEPLCSPSPIQIGNRVWRDDNNNGVQDPNEPSLAGIRVTLSGPGLSSPVSVTTNANGEYYFTNTTGTAATGYAYSLSLTSGGSYTLSFPTSFSTNTLSSKPNSATGTNADLIDSDANTNGIITFTLGESGQNNYSFDAGYVPGALAIAITQPVCNTATNQYVLTGTVSLTNVPDGTLTITDGVVSTTLAIPASTTSTTFSLTGLLSGSGSHTVTASYSNTALLPSSLTYSAPASCTVGVALSVTPGVCQSATNSYSISGTLSLTNAIAGIATISDGVVSTTLAVTAGATSVPYSLTGLTSGTGSHTVTVSYASKTVSTTYSAPAACAVSFSLSATPGICVSTTNQYSVSGTLSLTNAVAGTVTIIDGAISTTVAISAGATSVPYSLTGLTSGTGSHTVTVSYANQTISTTYSAPASCTVGVAIAAIPGVCVSATNQYSISGTLSLTNAIAGTATITDGTVSTTVAVTAGATSVPYSLTGFTSGTGSHTVVVTYATKTASATYTAPIACTVGVAVSVIPGVCVPATNQYTVSGTLSLTNAIAGTATITDGASTTTVSVSAGQTSVPYTLAGLSSGTGSHTVTVSYANQTVSATYTAPASCTLGVSLIITPSACEPTTNQYTLSGTLSLTNAQAGTATFTDGAISTTVAVAAGATSVSFSLSGLISGTGSHTLVASFNGNTQSQTYNAPTACSISVVISAIPEACVPATNQYSVSGILSLTNAIAGTATITDGTVSTTVAISAGATSVPYSLTGLTSGTDLHTVTVSYSSQTASTTYTAPVACTVGITLSVIPGACVPATNQYGVSGILSLTNAVAGIATITDGTISTTVAIAAGATSVPYSLTGLTSGTGNRTVTVSYATQTASATYVAPVSCTVGVAISATPGACAPATNQYAVSGTLSLTNAVAGTATITDGTSTTTVTINAGDTSIPYLINGLASDGASHTVTVSYANQAVSVQYTAPVSCSVAPPCLLTVQVTPGPCDITTNQYVVTGSVSAVNGIGSQIVTITDGVTSTTATLTGAGPVSFTLASKNSDGILHTVTASAANCGTNSTTYTAPVSCTPGVTLSATPDACQPATNQYSVSGTLSLTNAQAGTAIITDGTVSTTVAITAGATSIPYSLTGLSSGTANRTITVSYLSVTASTTYTAPASCSVAPTLSLEKRVSQSKANVGDLLTYTIVITNTSSATATAITVRDSVTVGLRYAVNSATAPLGTTFAPGSPVSTWTIPTLAPLQSLTLTFQAIADSSGILYNKAMIPGDTASVCTSIPYRVCQGESFQFELTAPTGRSSYQWYKDGSPILGETSNVLSVTAAGSYSLGVNNANGQCPDFSCCPFIIEEDSVPNFRANAIAATCIGNSVQVNGQIVLADFSSAYTYQYSAGATFDEAASLSGARQPIPANGIIANTLANPTTDALYTVRVYNSAGCYTDVTVILRPTVCGCPAEVCVPFVIQQTKRVKRIGDPR